MRHRSIAATFVLLCAPAGAALADSVKLSGFWIDDVTVQSIAEGRLIYVSASGGQVEKPIVELQGLKLTNLPQLEQAEKALEAGQAAQAVRLLQDGRRKSRQDWATQLFSKRLIEAQAAGGQATEAVQGYIEVSRTATDPWFVPAPPVDAVKAADGPAKARVRELATAALAQAAADQQAGLRQILDAAGAPTEAATPIAAGVPATAPATEPAAASAVPLPRTASGPIADLLRQGKFQEAFDAANQSLQQSGDLSANLFLKGAAQLALAEKSGDTDAFKDAGISFMRVVVYFPKSTSLGPALLEAGYVHQKIGRPDLARKLYDRARVHIDENDPAYFERMNQLLAAQ